MSFKSKLEEGKFVVLAEMHTPKGVNISKIMKDAHTIQGRIDAVIVPDMDNGIMRMSALAAGVLMCQEGIEAIIHMYCRDRNRMALQADALAAHVIGIPNILVVHSEDITQSDHREAKPVNDIDEVGFIQVLRGLMSGRDMEGFELDGIPSFCVGCTIAPYADGKALEKRIAAAKEKIDAGATFVISPPVFDIAVFEEFMSRAKGLGVPVIPTVFLLKSLAIAQYIASSEPASHISEETIRRIRKSSARDREGIRIAGETVAALKELASGVKIQTLGWEDRLPEILDVAGL